VGETAAVKRNTEQAAKIPGQTAHPAETQNQFFTYAMTKDDAKAFLNNLYFGASINRKTFDALVKQTYTWMECERYGLSMGEFTLAMTAYLNGVRGVEGNPHDKKALPGKFIFINYDQPKDKNRFYLFDFENFSIEQCCKVAQGSGNGMHDLSNKHTSVRGFVLIGGRHSGKKYKDAIKLWGCDEHYSSENGEYGRKYYDKISNHGMFDDAKIIHPADYVTDTYAGDSWGCPALSKQEYNNLKGFLSKIGVSNDRNAITNQNEIVDTLVIGGYLHYTRDGEFENYRGKSQYLRETFVDDAAYSNLSR